MEAITKQMENYFQENTWTNSVHSSAEYMFYLCLQLPLKLTQNLQPKTRNWAPHIGQNNPKCLLSSEQQIVSSFFSFYIGVTAEISWWQSWSFIPDKLYLKTNIKDFKLLEVMSTWCNEPGRSSDHLCLCSILAFLTSYAAGLDIQRIRVSLRIITS